MHTHALHVIHLLIRRGAAGGGGRRRAWREDTVGGETEGRIDWRTGQRASVCRTGERCGLPFAPIGRWDLRTEKYDMNSPQCFGPEQAQSLLLPLCCGSQRPLGILRIIDTNANPLVMVGVVIRLYRNNCTRLTAPMSGSASHDVTEKPFVMRGEEVPTSNVFGPQGFVQEAHTRRPLRRVLRRRGPAHFHWEAGALVRRRRFRSHTADGETGMRRSTPAGNIQS